MINQRKMIAYRLFREPVNDLSPITWDLVYSVPLFCQLRQLRLRFGCMPFFFFFLLPLYEPMMMWVEVSLVRSRDLYFLRSPHFTVCALAYLANRGVWPSTPVKTSNARNN